MIRGSWPNRRRARLTKWALRHASMPTMLAGSLLKVSISASRLILRRKAIVPSALKPTMWKTSLPMSMPIEAKRGVVVSMGCFSGCCGIVFEDYPRGGSSRSIPLAELVDLDQRAERSMQFQLGQQTVVWNDRGSVSSNLRTGGQPNSNVMEKSPWL